MSRACFDRLVNVIGHHRTETGDIKRLRTPIDQSTLMSLWMMFNPDTFRSFGVNCEKDMSVVHLHYKKFIRVMCEIGNRFIKWPNAVQRQRTVLFYERNFGFPGVVGSIDGTLISITAPREQKQRYVDKNSNYSINVQIVSDHRLLIRDVFIGQPGSVHDARVFRRSPLAKYLYSRNDMLDNDQHIVGDKAYVLTDKLMVPYRDDGHLGLSHRNFNFILSQCRCTVERLNALLKNRNIRLKKLFCKSIERTVQHIGAASVLHNFIILNGLEMDGIAFDGPVPEINVIEAMNARRQRGYDRRLFVRELLERNRVEEDEEDED
ncbi:hypothetical protein FOCC_FOCC012225 [Frankliniella occidentalis]|nr:hypothetical protein FOCC_FOCC012225 [Frankliniella occidentalis]